MIKIFCRTCGKQNIPGLFHQCIMEPAITAIKEALAQPVQAGAQPVQELLDEIAAQRKVLEQALVALKNMPLDKTVWHASKIEMRLEAITAIQEQLA